MGEWTLAHRIRWVASHIRRHGIRGFWMELRPRLSLKARAEHRRRVQDGISYDAAHGYRTAGVVAIDDFDTVGERAGSRHYDGVPTYDFADAIALVDIPLEGATFIDLGSGMGRAVLLAADLPFSRAIGVEFARELHEIAVANAIVRDRRSGGDERVEFIHADAGAFPVPAGALVYFLFNSFGPPTLTRVLRNIHASWVAAPRPIRFIYMNVQHPDEPTAAGFRQCAIAPDYKFTIYEPA